MPRMSSLQDGPRRSRRDLLDELFVRTDAYRSSEEFLELIRFVSDFRGQGPYNAYLLQRQNPRVSFVETATMWELAYRGTLRPGARPLVVLRPFGPVEFVYDIEDVDGGRIPPDLLEPFPVTGSVELGRFSRLLRSAQNHGIGFAGVSQSRYFGGKVTRLTEPVRIRRVDVAPTASPMFRQFPLVEGVDEVEARFVIELNDLSEPEAAYSTILHELAHLLCGHLGYITKDGRSAVDRSRPHLEESVAELEAEAAAYVAGRRTGVETRSEAYLATYFDKALRSPTPHSIDAILSAAGRLESWGLRVARPPKSRSGRRSNADHDDVFP